MQMGVHITPNVLRISAERNQDHISENLSRRPTPTNGEMKRLGPRARKLEIKMGDSQEAKSETGQQGEMAASDSHLVRSTRREDAPDALFRAVLTALGVSLRSTCHVARDQLRHSHIAGLCVVQVLTPRWPRTLLILLHLARRL